MSYWNNVNLELRIEILDHSLRLEQITSEIMKALLRIFKDKTKTLSNKSSSLSFKNKIDLLYDLEEFSIKEYGYLIKFIEIRNQFIHNQLINSFTELLKDYPDIEKYFKTNFKNEIEDKEKSFYKSYHDLYGQCLIKLLAINKEYLGGIRYDYEKYLAYKVINNIDELIDNTNENIKKAKLNNFLASPPFINIEEKYVNDFKLAFIIEKDKMYSEYLKELDDNYQIAFKRKISIDELLNEYNNGSKIA